MTSNVHRMFVGRKDQGKNHRCDRHPDFPYWAYFTTVEDDTLRQLSTFHDRFTSTNLAMNFKEKAHAGS